ncbi:MAG: hypothetical protein M1838_001050 [Thelocarpon superellum]|nr:MAG: hypothetical protein M1838_001050 [Thelocarpon superellum]
MPKRKDTPTKRRDYLSSMEGRIKAMESVIDRSGLVVGQLRDEEENMPSMLERQAELSDQLSFLVIKERGVSNFIGPSSGLSLFSPHGLRWISERIESDQFRRLMSIMSEAQLLNHTEFRNIVFSPLPSSEREPCPPKAVADEYVKCYFYTFNSIFPLYNESIFRDYYERQYSADPPTGASWYASFNVVLAMGRMIRRSRNQDAVVGPALDEVEASRKYFRNASSTFVDLQFKDYNLMSIQALVGMAFMMQSTSDPHPPYVLTAAAARLAHAIGLHRRLNADFGLSAAQTQDRRNVFWILYMLDKATSLRSGRPSVINDEDVGIDLPSHEEGQEPNKFRSMAILALLESRVYSRLYSARSRTRSRFERLKAVSQLDLELQKWRDALPMEIRPEREIRCSKQKYMPVVMMHFAYYNCLTAIHRMSVHSGAWTAEPDKETPPDGRLPPLNPRVYSSGPICLSAARHVIKLTQSLDQDDDTPLDNLIWMAFQYPLSASLALFANVLQHPTDSQALPDVALMRVVVQTLSKSVQQGKSTTSVGMLKIFEELNIIAAETVAKAQIEHPKNLRRRRDEATEVLVPGRPNLAVPQLAEFAFSDMVDQNAVDLDQELRGLSGMASASDVTQTPVNSMFMAPLTPASGASQVQASQEVPYAPTPRESSNPSTTEGDFIAPTDTPAGPVMGSDGMPLSFYGNSFDEAMLFQWDAAELPTMWPDVDEGTFGPTLAGG